MERESDGELWVSMAPHGPKKNVNKVMERESDGELWVSMAPHARASPEK